jgi:adenosylcobinamide-GDP ribazoletransferase
VRRAIAFLTPIPVGGGAPDSRTYAWFPIVGALMGLALGGTWWLADRAFAPAVAAALVLVADLALTGMLHVDGLADTADGLLPHLDGRARRLEVMAAPDIGAFGVTVVVGVLLLRFAALASQPVSVLLLAGLWCGSRTLMVAGAGALPYMRGEGSASDEPQSSEACERDHERGGLGTTFEGRDWRPIALYGLIAAVSLGAFADGRRTEVAVGASFAAGALVLLAARRRIGGYTGDVLGAAGIIGETVGLVVAAARW